MANNKSNEILDKFISQIKNMKLFDIDESETKGKLILPILQKLGWNTDDYNEVSQEYPIEGKRVDLSLRNGNVNEVFIEVKRIGVDLSKDKHQEQLLGYAFRYGVDLAILTNGLRWWFYLPMKKGEWKTRIFHKMDIVGQEQTEIVSKMTGLLSKKSIIAGKSMEMAENIYKDKLKMDEMIAVKNEISIKYPTKMKLSKSMDVAQQKRVDFFKSLLEKSKDKTHLFLNVSPTSGRYGSISTNAGIRKVRLTYFPINNDAAVELIMERSNSLENKIIYDALLMNRNEIEKELGEERIEWKKNEKGNVKRCTIRKWFGIGGLNSPNIWNTLHDKMIDSMIKFDRVFRRRLKQVEIAIAELKS